MRAAGLLGYIELLFARGNFAPLIPAGFNAGCSFALYGDKP